MASEGRLILLTAGGSGGHLTPARALASDLLPRGYRVELATDTRSAAYGIDFSGVPVHVLKAGTFGGGIRSKIKGAALLAAGFIQALILLARRKPALVVGFGGYPSVPTVLAAQMTGIPVIIHEQNAVLGKANAFLAKRAARIALSWPQVRGAEKAQGIVTGNPVRPAIAALHERPYEPPAPDGPFHIFVMGGSQGAQVFAEILPAALARLSSERRARLRVVQQCRQVDLAEARRAYEDAGIQAELNPFFQDVAKMLAQSHIFIGRSGAGTVAEVTVAGLPAIYVPYPHHADQQQKVNAEAVADVGGGWVMAQGDFTPQALAVRMEGFFDSPETLAVAAAAARSCGRPDAARKLGDLVAGLAGKAA